MIMGLGGGGDSSSVAGVQILGEKRIYTKKERESIGRKKMERTKKRKESIRKKKEKENSHRGGLEAIGRRVGVNAEGGRYIA